MTLLLLLIDGVFSSAADYRKTTSTEKPNNRLRGYASPNKTQNPFRVPLACLHSNLTQEHCIFYTLRQPAGYDGGWKKDKHQSNWGHPEFHTKPVPQSRYLQQLKKVKSWCHTQQLYPPPPKMKPFTTKCLHTEAEKASSATNIWVEYVGAGW